MKYRPIALIAAALTLVGCEYAGPAGEPVSRNLTWFDYVGAEGFKEACGPGASSRLRFVYNGIYDKQIRSYDLHELPRGRGAAMSAWARGVGDLTRAIRLPNLFSPWQGNRVESVVGLKEWTDLKTALAADRFSSFKPVGLRLPSNEFYWVVAGCLDGRFHANAWMYPSKRFKSLNFPGILRAHDRTGIEFENAVPVNQRDEDPTIHEGDRNWGSNIFQIQLGADGIVGAKGLF